MKPAIRNKRKELLPKGDLLLHDTPCLLSAAASVEAIRWVKSEVLPYSYIAFTVNLTTISDALYMQCPILG
jgi:hypothetical protein